MDHIPNALSLKVAMVFYLNEPLLSSVFIHMSHSLDLHPQDSSSGHCLSVLFWAFLCSPSIRLIFTLLSMPSHGCVMIWSEFHKFWD